MRYNYKHGLYRSRIIKIWHGMKQRCLNPNDPRYADYGGRGIRICPEWMDFQRFFTDMGHPPAGHTLDRIDGDGNYCLTNCRWATRYQQQNNMRSNARIAFQGLCLTQTEWSRKLGFEQGVLSTRLRRGWSVADALLIRPTHKFVRDRTNYRRWQRPPTRKAPARSTAKAGGTKVAA